ncbi:MAG: hypothetical protein R3304_05995 [Longimicrobiales bacterium]|nr:hypothetical protein [Longimicrobiales bacterium]
MSEPVQAQLGTHERRLMESESRWLQKALFALSKAEDDRTKLEDALTGTLPPLKVDIEGNAFDIETVRNAMVEAVQERSETLRATLRRGSAVVR